MASQEGARQKKSVSFINFARGRVEENAGVVGERARNVKGYVADGAKKASDSAKNAAKSVAERNTDWALEKSRVAIKASLDDEKAPRFVRNLTATVFDAVWPELAEEVKGNVMAAVNEQFHGRPPAWTEPRKVWGLGKLRAWFLHTYLPHDASIFEQLRWPSYWLLTLWSVIPYYGCMFSFWLVMFLVMDRRDEYTLINYILSFKSLQFLTLGFAGMAVGAGMTVYCLTHDVEQHTCDKDGPGLQKDFFIQLGAFGLQAFLSWICFALLPYSKQKGGTQPTDPNKAHAASPPSSEELELTQYRPTAGGYLRKLVIYDIVCFLLVLAWIAATATRPHVLDEEHIWIVRATGYWAKTLYGLLSLPFIIFVIPPFNLIFTHAVPTGHDQAGDAVPLLTAVQRAEKEAAESGGGAKAGKPLDHDREVAV